MEVMMAKLLKEMKSTDAGIKEMKYDLYLMSQLIDSHSTLIKKLEHHMSQLSTTLSSRRAGLCQVT